MTKYKYNKKDNKFTENGHTMFESDELRRLERLADLEVKFSALEENKSLIPNDFSNQKEVLEWISNESQFRIPKDEKDEILEDWEIYKLNKIEQEFI